jgi:hypothetical protein
MEKMKSLLFLILALCVASACTLTQKLAENPSVGGSTRSETEFSSVTAQGDIKSVATDEAFSANPHLRFNRGPGQRPDLEQLPRKVEGTLAPEQETFWQALSAHCGKAYAGLLSDATEYYLANLDGRAAVIHFFHCSENRLHVSFQLDEDRSRNWILTRTADTLQLKHDHRHIDGTEDQVSQYGGDAPKPGLANRQIFWADAHTAAILPERQDNFWFLEISEGRSLQYGVHWPTHGHSARFEFDLSAPIPPPDAPWGW